MPSFDIVSEVDKHILTNAVDQANRVIGTRFDFKGADASFELTEFVISLRADGEFQLKQMRDMLRTSLTKNNIDVQCLDLASPQTAGKQVKQDITVRTGLDSALAKKIVKMIKDKKFKVQAQIQGDQVRVTGKKRDDLQQVIAMLRDAELDMPLQFDNFRD